MLGSPSIEIVPFLCRVDFVDLHCTDLKDEDLDCSHHKNQNHDLRLMDFFHLLIDRKKLIPNQIQVTQVTMQRPGWTRSCPGYPKIWKLNMEFSKNYTNITEIILVKTELKFIWELKLMLVDVWWNYWWQDWRNQCCWRLILDDMVKDTVLVVATGTLSPVTKQVLSHGLWLLHIIIIRQSLMGRYCRDWCCIASIGQWFISWAFDTFSFSWTFLQVIRIDARLKIGHFLLPVIFVIFDLHIWKNWQHKAGKCRVVSDRFLKLIRDQAIV